MREKIITKRGRGKTLRLVEAFCLAENEPYIFYKYYIRDAFFKIILKKITRCNT